MEHQYQYVISVLSRMRFCRIPSCIKSHGMAGGMNLVTCIKGKFIHYISEPDE